jgi:DNA-binding winged helix-turn-helix (wHTH) protein/tetratricopeptide (TPR) repeat protein
MLVPAPTRADDAYEFGAFQLDCGERLLWHLGRRLDVRGKPFEMLALLVKSAGHTLTKEVLLNALWPDVAVHENNIAVAVRTIRRALQEHAPDAVFIETVPGRGYRWVQPTRAIVAPRVSTPQRSAPALLARASQDAFARSLPALAPGFAREEPFVGREPELQGLQARWAGAQTGAGGVVFISGELGMGKSALLQRFLGLAIASTPESLLLAGHCQQLLGSAEPYLPWLESLRVALTGPARARWVQALRQYAPAWRARLPTSFEPGEQPADADGRAPVWEQPSLGPRELVEAILSVASEHSLLLALEDLHWADASSVDVLRLLLARLDGSRVLVLVSYRPVEVALGSSAPQPLGVLLRDLDCQGRRDELCLVGLAQEQLQQYLSARFGTRPFTTALAQALWQQTEGLPLFVTCVIRALVDGEQLRPEAGGWSLVPSVSELGAGVCRSIEAVFQSHFERLSAEDRQTLDAASIEGHEFGVALVARLLGQDPVLVEQRLERLLLVHRLLEHAGEERLRGGVLDPRYRFSHVLFQNFLYRRLPHYQRSRWHRQAARSSLALYAGAESRWPARLAFHFERGRDFRRAVIFFTAAGDAAERAHAKLEALDCYARASALLDELPPEQRRAFELVLHHGQAWASFGLARFSVAEQHFDELIRLAGELEKSADRALGIGTPPLASDAPALARSSRQRTLDYFQRPWSDSVMQRPARILPETNLQELGVELRAEALRGQCCVLYTEQRTVALAERAGELLQLSESYPSAPRRVEALGWLGAGALAVGCLSEALPHLEEAIALARSCEHDRGLCLALQHRASLHLMQAEFPEARAALEECLLRVPEVRSAAEALWGLAEAHAKQGQLHAAFAAYQRAEQLMQRIRPGFPALHGWLLCELGQHAAAYQSDAAAVTQLTRQGDRPLRARLLGQLAHAACLWGELGRARQHLDEAEGLITGEQRQCPARMHPMYAARCELLYRAGQLAPLHEVATSWWAGAEECHDREGVRCALRWLARIEMKRRRWQAARSQVEAAIELSKTHPVQLTDWRSQALLGEIAGRLNDDAAAQLARAEARRQQDALKKQWREVEQALVCRPPG